VDELWTASWRVYPATGLVLLGAGVVAAAVRAGLTGSDWRQGGAATALAYLLLFRRLAVGLALAGVGVAWIEQVPWLLGASACIGLGELLETSFDIGVIRWGQRRALLPPAGKPRPVGGGARRPCSLPRQHLGLT
jgi:hypothetical protein